MTGKDGEGARSSSTRSARRPVLALATAAIAGTAGLLAPFVPEVPLVAILLLALAALHLAFRRKGERIAAGLVSVPGAVPLLVAAAAVAVTVGGGELVARALVDAGVVEVYQPMRTLVPEGTEDWRLAHLTADRFREPDPVLWWRPVAGPPYNGQRFKGEEVAPGEQPTLRIFCYGDSNTDGPPVGGWPQRLQELLRRERGPRSEVVNAGVAGYSSHQGLLRFREEAARYRPDVVLVSFGWNDAATTMGPADDAFEPPPAALVRLQRVAVELELYRALLGLRRSARPAPAAVGRARVSVAAYERNLASFVEVAERHGARVVVLTRPHREPAATLAAAGGWRAAVPSYNAAARRFCRSRRVPLVDVQRHFATPGSAFADECHFTADGHEAMARLVARRLERYGLLGEDAGG